MKESDRREPRRRDSVRVNLRKRRSWMEIRCHRNKTDKKEKLFGGD